MINKNDFFEKLVFPPNTDLGDNNEMIEKVWNIFERVVEKNDELAISILSNFLEAKNNIQIFPSKEITYQIRDKMVTRPAQTAYMKSMQAFEIKNDALDLDVLHELGHFYYDVVLENKLPENYANINTQIRTNCYSLKNTTFSYLGKQVENGKFSNLLEIICNEEEKEKVKYTDISIEELSTFQTSDLDGFKDYFYNLFYDFEMAYNNLDYNTMKLLSTKQLFQNYHTGLTLDSKQGNKRIIKDITREKVIVFETISTTIKQAVSTVITISYISYVENGDGKIISGNKDSKITESFEVIFRKNFGDDTPTNCPNCGAPISSEKCEFCNTVINNVDFRIASIKKIINF